MKYDVFFSYKRHPQMLDWTRRVYEQFKFHLTMELGGSAARVFFDEREIELGEKWPDELRSAIRRSKCLVCIWSPMYFQSAWCVAEWRSFLAREQEIESTRRQRLIAPLKYHDGEHFPTEATDTQWCDVSEFTSSLPSFWNSRRALQLEDKLKGFSRTVADIIRSAPAFQHDWPIVEDSAALRPRIPLARL